MLIISIRTDRPEAELSLYDGEQQIAHLNWQAHRELAETLHGKIAALLSDNQKTLQDIEGIVVFKGPGSFTGLRIGVTVANALAYSLHVPIVANEDPNWVTDGILRLQNGESETVALPEYGALPHITPQKK